MKAEPAKGEVDTYSAKQELEKPQEQTGAVINAILGNDFNFFAGAYQCPIQ